MSSFLNRFRQDESGATAIEYGLIVGCIFLAILGAMQFFSTTATDKFIEAATAIADAGS